MAASSKPLLRCSGRRVSSSIANITPPSGVLNAAAMPAAPPAIISPCSDTCERSGSQRRAWCITPAAICTDGPSRPRERPASSPQLDNSIFEKLSLSETYRPRCSRLTSGDSAAITCGMPEPAAPGTQRRVSQTMAAVEAGTHSSGAHQWLTRTWVKCSKASSVIQVKATTVSPASAAKASTRPRPVHRRQSYNSLRNSWATCGWGLMGCLDGRWGIDTLPQICLLY